MPRAAPAVAGGRELRRRDQYRTSQGHFRGERDGFRGYIALYDADRGLGLAVTFWEDEQTEQASDEASRASREQLGQSFGAKVSVEKYDVALAELE